MFAVTIALLAGAAGAQAWDYGSALSLQETATSNVNLEPSGSRRSDFVTEITPDLRFRERGARTTLDGTVSLPVLLYARTGNENNDVFPSLNISGNADLVDHFFFVDGAVSVAQQYFSPFGARPTDLVNATANRYRTASYRVSPYIKGVTQDNTEYEVRNNDVWTNLSGAPADTANSFYTEWLARASNTQARLGWKAEYDYTDVRFENQLGTIRTQLGRFTPLYNIDPQLRLSASVGYEDNQYALTGSRNAVYGVGVEWRPSDRTSLVGNWEHRFFGSSYLFTFDTRTPLSVWSVQASRNITTYPQQLGALQPGVDVAALVNSLFLSSITDPLARQHAVDQFLADRGLPAVLTGPVNLYSQQILLEQSQSATAGLRGARNSIFLTIYNIRSEAIAGSGLLLPTQLFAGNNNRQTGATLVWTYNISPSLALAATLDAFRTVANAPLVGKTNQGAARLVLTSTLTARTTAFVGARYQTLSSEVTTDYNELAAFVGLSHTFR